MPARAPRRSRLPHALALACLGACHASVSVAPDLGEPIQINQVPTGTIQTPSLCERTQVDTRVTTAAVDSFAFAWTGDHYQVVYADLAEHALHGIRLSEAGAPIGVETLLEMGGGATEPALLATDAGWLVVWTDATSPATVRTVALDGEGTALGSPQTLAIARSAQIRPVLAPSPDGPAIAWMDQVAGSAPTTHDLGTSTTYVGLVDPQALTLRTDVPTRQIDASADTGYPWLAGDATALALLWSEQISTSAIDTELTLLGDDLAPGPTIDARDAPGATSSALLGRLALTDFGYVAAWEDSRSGSEEIYMSLFQPSGDIYYDGLVEEPGTGSANWPHMAWTGSALAVVYYQFRSGKPQVFMTFLDESGARVGGAADAQVSDTSEWARYPDLAWTGSAFGVLWIDARDGQPKLYYNRVACTQPASI